MTTIKIKGGIYLDVSEKIFNEPPDGSDLTFFRGITQEPFASYMPVMPHTIEVTMPAGWDPRMAMVEALQAKEKQVRADFAREVAEIHDRIGKLLAIEGPVVMEMDAPAFVDTEPGSQGDGGGDPLSDEGPDDIGPEGPF